MDFASLLIKADSRQPKQATKDLASLEHQAKKTDTTVSKLGGSFKTFIAAAAVGITIHSVTAQIKDLSNSASDLFETISKTEQIFGDSASSIKIWSEDSAKAMGQSQRQALDAAGTFAIFAKSAGVAGDELVAFSERITVLASDLASFYNTSPEDAIVAIGAAMRGEMEPIRRYGVMLDDVTLRQEALRMGLIKTTKEALTPQQKILAASEQIFKQTAIAQGDYLRTADGLANTQREYNATIEDTKAKLGEDLMPLMKQWYDLLIKIADVAVDPLSDLLKGLSIEIRLLKGESLESIRTTEALSAAMKKGGHEGASILFDRLGVLNEKFAETKQKIEDIQNPSTALGRIWQAMGGSKLGDDLKIQQEQLKKYEDQIKKVKEALSTISDNAPEKPSAPAAIASPVVEDTSWSDFGKILDQTSKLNEQKLEITKQSNAAITAENERQLAADIRRDEEYRMLVESAEMARIDNIPNQIERELALHEYKFARMKEIYQAGSDEMLAIEAIQESKRQAIIKKSNNLAFDAGQDFFGSMANLTKQFAGEQSEAYMTMFNISKAFALAKAGLKLGEALSEAGASAPPPYNLIPIAIAGAEFATIIADIAAVNFAGMKDKGGTIPAGKWGIAGEFGPEIINGPATVTSREETASMLGKGMNVKVINVLDPDMLSDYLSTDKGEELVMNVIRRNRDEIGF